MVHPERIDALERRIDLLTDLVALAIGGLCRNGVLDEKTDRAVRSRVGAFGTVYASDEARSRKVKQMLDGI